MLISDCLFIGNIDKNVVVVVVILMLYHKEQWLISSLRILL